MSEYMLYWKEFYPANNIVPWEGAAVKEREGEGGRPFIL